MTLSTLAKYVLAVLLHSTGPGQSIYSMQAMPECGTDPAKAECPLKRVCASASPLCAAPRWSKARNAWVRVEGKEHAAMRLEVAAYSIVRAGTYLLRCKTEDGSIVEDCTPVRWGEGTHSLVFAMLGSSMWESGYREDIMNGYPPAGRGPDGEACVMQVMPNQIRQYADWAPAKPVDEMTDEDWAQEILGEDVEHLYRCFLVGGRMLSRLRRTSAAVCGANAGFYGMYALYGTGKKCSSKDSPLGDWALLRADTYAKLMKNWPNGYSTPDWAIPLFGQLTGATTTTAKGVQRNKPSTLIVTPDPPEKTNDEEPKE